MNKFTSANFKMNQMEGGSTGPSASTNVQSYANPDLGTFDDFDLDDVAPSSFEDKIEKLSKKDEEEEAPKAPKKEKREEVLDLSDDEFDSEDKGDKKEEKKDKKAEKAKKEDEDEEEKAEEKPEEEKEKEEKAEKAKKIKVRTKDGLYGLEADASVRVKIDGEYQDVPMQELINNYSGKTAWDKKFTEIGQEKKALEVQKQEVDKTVDFLKTTLTEVLRPIQDSEANPLDALYYLVEKSGGDPYTVYRRMLETNLEEVEKLLDMSDVERKAYWLEKKDEFRSKREENLQKATKEQEALNQAVQKVDQLRQAHGVSEEQFLNALDELESQGQNPSNEEVVEYASLKPHLETVRDILEPYEDEIDDSKYSEIVQQLARNLRNQDFTKEQISEWAKQEFADEDLKDLSSRVQPQPKKEIKHETKYESALTLDFDDDED